MCVVFIKNFIWFWNSIQVRSNHISFVLTWIFNYDFLWQLCFFSTHSLWYWSLVTMGAAHWVALQLPDLVQPTNCSQRYFVTLLGEGWNFAALQYDPIACLLWFLLPTNGRHRGRSLQSLEHSDTSLCSPIYHVSVAVTTWNRVESFYRAGTNAKSKFVFRYYEAVAVVIKYFFLMSLSDNVHVLIVCMP